MFEQPNPLWLQSVKGAEEAAVEQTTIWKDFKDPKGKALITNFIWGFWIKFYVFKCYLVKSLSFLYFKHVYTSICDTFAMEI